MLTPIGIDLSADESIAQSALMLAMAAVPVEGTSLTAGARSLLDPDLVRLLDLITPAAVSDLAVREEMSLQLCRKAWSLAGYPRGTKEAVMVLIPENPPPLLVSDLEHQTWQTQLRGFDPSVRDDRRLAAGFDAALQSSTYVTRLDSSLRYGPHHLADLVHGLRHSGAAVAHSPARFWPWGRDTWLEDEKGAENYADGGLTGGSLWYASDGLATPRGEGYAIHGGNAVPYRAPPPPHLTAWRLHLQLPRALNWLDPSGDPESGSSGGDRN